LGVADVVLASLIEEGAEREPTPEERRLDAVARPTGQLVPLYRDDEQREPREIARAAERTWD
jgi:hypothetical protein